MNFTNVCLLGHSFIRRLDDFMDNSYNYYNLRLPESKFNIISRAKGGLTIRRLINERPELFDFGNIRISIVYIQLGGNDLSRQSAEKTATDLVSFANFLNELAPVVIVGQLLFRNPVKVGELYNTKVVECNKLIETSIKDNPNIIFWHHRGFSKDLTHLHGDGTHLNDQGMLKYHRSIRSAILHANNIC
jgi:lysophospholipase L1-like esterase